MPIYSCCPVVLYSNIPTQNECLQEAKHNASGSWDCLIPLSTFANSFLKAPLTENQRMNYFCVPHYCLLSFG